MSDAQAVKAISQQQTPHIIDSGIVRAIRGQYLDIVLDGSRKQVKDVILAKSIAEIKVGWWVVVVRQPRSNHWVALAALESISGGSRATVSDLTQPGSVTATAKPYLIELSWSGSFRDVATYEVQHNSSASESGATMIKVEGSNFFYWCAPGTQRYFRVRAVSSIYERSSWSSWVNATASAGSAYELLQVSTGGVAPEWTDEIMPDRLGVGTASIPAMDGVIGMAEVPDRPPFAPNEGRIYVKDDGGDTELFYVDDDGNEVQLTADGVLNAAAVDHGGLAGLPDDDDHPQYFLADGSRALAGSLVLPKASGYGIKVDNATPTFGWRDLRAEIRTRGVGSSDPNDATYIGNIKAYSFSVGDEAWIEFHIPHDYVAGTDIHLHFHWSHNSANVTGGSVTWEADVTYAKGHDQAAFAVTVNPTLVANASTTQYQHLVSEVQLSASAPSATQIDTDDLEPDGIILARVCLNANNITSDNGVPDPFLHEVDVHYQSTNIATKGKVPDFYA